MTPARRQEPADIALRSHVGVSGRISVVEDSHQPIFQPSNADVLLDRHLGSVQSPARPWCRNEFCHLYHRLT